jgi:hypothetical protein
VGGVGALDASQGQRTVVMVLLGQMSWRPLTSCVQEPVSIDDSQSLHSGKI